jgi:hypothetical protein
MSVGRSARHGLDIEHSARLINMRHQTIPTDEIVEEIMDNLRPWTRPESEVETIIQKTIESLRKRNSPEFEFEFSRGAIKKSAQEFVAAIAQVEKSLQHIHPVVAGLVFAEMEMESRHPSYKEAISAFQKKLGWMRWLGESFTRNPPGSHPNFDHAKNGCARSALLLMRKFSHQTPTGTAEGPFRTISSLLYQATSGKRLDLKRACDGALLAERKDRQSILWLRAKGILDEPWMDEVLKRGYEPAK